MGDTSPVNAPGQDGNQTTDSTSGGGGAFKPITSQDELNRIIDERLRRERAKYADYADLKAKAAKLDELEAANKSEIEKAVEARTKAEQAAAQAAAEALRWRIAAEHGISVEDAELFLTGTDEETLTKQAQRLAERVADRRKNGNVVPREGSTSQPKDDEMREFTRRLFSGSE